MNVICHEATGAAEKLSVGAERYPLPRFVTVTLVTTPLASIVAVAVALVPPAGGCENVMVGAVTYPNPPLPRVIRVSTTPPAPIVADALAERLPTTLTFPMVPSASRALFTFSAVAFQAIGSVSSPRNRNV